MGQVLEKRIVLAKKFLGKFNFFSIRGKLIRIIVTNLIMILVVLINFLQYLFSKKIKVKYNLIKIWYIYNI